MTHFWSSVDTELIESILKNNLFLIDNQYILLNVTNQKTSEIETLCLGEINSIQTNTNAQTNAMLDSSSSSELQSDVSS
ncbi:lef10 [Oxyplax ochracea nucleopolyhedrovirus]|uniref:Lef10 n=1 Tax=Oxyplax ochracea nucleopolyhedrovirus TaxID=2083176 RepID=A0A2L0WU57_9ABAC|nr:lef10 [Oxyplax ochracea nucleopolyhedrovirus]AVA31180.1 lef10 [Oxyplax ochracea nucleopolyhedrovirus]